jgi:hypothetical protein
MVPALRRAFRRIGRAAVRVGSFVRSLPRERSARERVWASATFALIFALLVGGVDYVLTGGPEWTPGAAPAPSIEPVQRVEATTLPMRAFPLPPPVEADDETDKFALADFSTTNEELLGGPELMAVSDEQLELTPEMIDVSYTPDAPVRIKTKAALSASLDESLW